MKTTSILAGVVIAALNALALVPSLQSNAAYFVAGAIAVALWLALKAIVAKPVAAVAETSEPAATAAPRQTTPEPVVERLAEAEAIALLGVFQSKGRLVDFLMDDIAGYSDAQVGAAARVVQQGCKAALAEHFTIEPIAVEAEGTRITVPEGAEGTRYSLVGKVSGEPPFSGVLVHKGWRATSVKLPRSLTSSEEALPPIAPAQVELR